MRKVKGSTSTPALSPSSMRWNTGIWVAKLSRAPGMSATQMMVEIELTLNS